MAVESRKRRTPRWLNPRTMITVLVILAAVALFLVVSRATVSSPSRQLTVNMGTMGQELVNVWFDPDPPKAAGTTVVAQVADLGGNPRSASSITFRMGRGDAEPVQEKAGEPMDAANRTERGRFRAVLEFSSTGDWWIEVVVEMGGERVIVRLPVQVEQ